MRPAPAAALVTGLILAVPPVCHPAGDGTALAYSAESGDLLRLLEGHSGPVHACVVTRKGRFAVTVSEDAGVRVWDLAARLAQPRGYHEGRVYCVTGAPAGSVLATCGEDCDARLWDARSGTFKVRLGAGRGCGGACEDRGEGVVH